MAVQVASIVFQIAADMKNIQGQLRTLENNFNASFSKIQAAGRTLGSVLGVSLGVGALVGFTKSVVETAARLKDLEIQTGLSAQFLSGFENTVNNAGVSVDEFASGWERLVRSLAEGGEDASRGEQRLKQLGFTATEIAEAFQEPEKFLERLAKRLAEIQSPVQRLAVAQDIAGRSGGRMAAALVDMADGFEDIRNRGLSQADLDRLDAADKTFARLGNRIKIFAAEAISDIARTIDKIKELAALNLSGLTGAEGGPGAFLGGVGQGGLQVGDQPSPLEGAIRQPPRTGRPQPLTTAATDAARKAADSFIASLQKQADQLRVNIQEQKLGGDAARRLGLEFEFAALKAKLLADGKVLPPGVEQQFQRLVDQIQSLAEELNRAKFEADRLTRAVEADDLDRSAWLTFSEDVDKLIIKPLEDAKKAWDNLRIDQLGEAFDLDSSAWATFPEEVQRLIIEPGQKAAMEWHDTVTGLIQGAARGITDSMRSIALGTQEAGEAFRNLGQAILASLTDAIIQLTIITPLIEGLKKALTAGSSGGGGFDFGNFFGSIAKGLFGFDEGGVVPGRIGQPRLVMAHAGETILPTHKSPMAQLQRSWGGAQQITVDFQNAQIIPRAPWTTPADVVKVTAKNIKDQSDVYVAMRQYGPGRQ